MERLNNYISRIEGFFDLNYSEKIGIFGHFLITILEKEAFTSKDIESCFRLLRLQPYSNTSSYLSKNSKGRNANFIRCGNGMYALERLHRDRIDKSIGEIQLPQAIHSSFIPFELFDNARGYVRKIAEQAINSYDLKLYDASSVLIRKLCEVLIIESFERYRISHKVINQAGNFYYLNDLVDILIQEPAWNIGRNAKQSLPQIKKLGDLSAHNRRYIARRSDLQGIKDDLRIVLEELLHIIDYPTWKP